MANYELDNDPATLVFRPDLTEAFKNSFDFNGRVHDTIEPAPVIELEIADSVLHKNVCEILAKTEFKEFIHEIYYMLYLLKINGNVIKYWKPEYEEDIQKCEQQADFVKMLKQDDAEEIEITGVHFYKKPERTGQNPTFTNKMDREFFLWIKECFKKHPPEKFIYELPEKWNEMLQKEPSERTKELVLRMRELMRFSFNTEENKIEETKVDNIVIHRLIVELLSEVGLYPTITSIIAGANRMHTQNQLLKNTRHKLITDDEIDAEILINYLDNKVMTPINRFLGNEKVRKTKLNKLKNELEELYQKNN